MYFKVIEGAPSQGCLLGPVQGALTIFNTCLAGGNEQGRYRGGDEGRDEATSSETYGKRWEGKDQ